MRFSVETRSFTSAATVTVSPVRGSLGGLPSAGSRQGGGTVWTIPFEVEGVTVRVTVVYIEIT